MGKKALFVQVLLLMAFLLTGCGYAGPEKAVRREMDLIQKLDEPAIKAFVSYEDIRMSHTAPLEIGAETTEAVKLFFKNFKYRILSSAVSDDETTATVNLEITNLDAHMLAKDLCRELIRTSVSQEGTDQEGLASSFALMKKCLEENTYPTVTKETVVNLTYVNRSWVIQESAELEDALAGGLVSYLRDPYLLPPEEVLECTLSPFADFTAEEWKNYLDLEDVFNTGSSLAPQIDDALAEQLAEHFSYEILSVSQENTYATAEVKITSPDLSGVLERCRASLLEYAKTTESIRATDEEIAQKTAEYLLAELQASASGSTDTITISLMNNGYTWDVLLDEDFADAILGGVNNAIQRLSAEEQSDTEPTES